jgi:hypothetical protein
MAGGRLRVMMRGGGVQQENPSAPTGLTPVHGASSVSISALLQWNPAAGATSYDVYLDTVNGSTLICNDVVGTSCDPTLDYSTTYYAKVCSNPGGACTGVQSWTTEVQSGAGELITGADLTYLGAFKLPSALNSLGGALAFSSTGDNGSGSLYIASRLGVSGYINVAEISIPTPFISETCNYTELNEATLIQDNTDPSGGMAQAEDANMTPLGLAVVNIPNIGPKLFFSFYKYYYVSYADVHGFGYCDLTIGQNVKGMWTLAGYSHARISGYIGLLPEAWANAHTGGRRLISANNTSTQSGASQGFGAIAWAPWVDDPGTASPEHHADLSSVALADFYQSSGVTEYYQQMVIPEQWGLKPAAPQNYWWASDNAWGLTYIQASDGRTAMIGAVAMANGYEWYQNGVNGTLLAENAGEHHPPQPEGTVLLSPKVAAGGTISGYHYPTRAPVFMFFDLADYAQVASGSKNKWDVRPYAMHDLRTDVVRGGYRWNAAHDPVNQWEVAGVTFDPLTRRVYVVQLDAYRPSITNKPLIHVYQVR